MGSWIVRYDLCVIVKGHFFELCEVLWGEVGLLGELEVDVAEGEVGFFEFGVLLYRDGKILQSCI